MKTLEEIAYDAGRHALAVQESLVGGIRQRTGTLLAAHALVASFLGSAPLRADGLRGWNWVALYALVLALVTAAALLAPWKLDFAVDARSVYALLYRRARGEALPDELEWLVVAGFGYQDLRDRNGPRVRIMSALSALLALLLVLQTLAWIAAVVG